MLAIVKRVSSRYSFATTRAKNSNKHKQTEQSREKDAFKSYKSQVEKGSILRQFREDVFRRAELTGNWANPAEQDKEALRMKKLLKNQQNKESLMKNMTNIEARVARNRTIFDENSGHSLLSDYGNYKPYESVYPVLEDRNLGERQYLEDSDLTQNIYKFLDTLPDEYLEKEHIRGAISQLPANQQNKTIAEYGRQLQNKINQTQRMALRRYEEHKEHNEFKYNMPEPFVNQADVEVDDWYGEKYDDDHLYTGIPKAVDPFTNSQNLDATLSSQAVDTIYELYLQGWSIRDISKRFGILPARAKFCVWVRAQFYHEVVPKMGVDYYLRVLRYEQRWNQGMVFCDYGLDIQEMSNDKILEEITQWNGKMLDAERKESKYLGAMQKVYEKKKFKKYQMVEVGKVGKEHSEYKLKEWKVFRGKGSDEYFLKNNLLKTLTRAQLKFTKQYY